MKRLLCFVLALVLALGTLSGCREEDDRDKKKGSADWDEAGQMAMAALREDLSLPETAEEELVVEQVDQYEDETVVRYAQTYEGVEIFGSSMVVAMGDEDLCVGTYYDLSNAFGEDFRDLADQAETVPDWMTTQYGNNGTLYYQTDTLRPVIYILPDKTAVVARCVEALVETGDSRAVYTLVLSLDGKTIYTWQTCEAGFTDAAVTGPNDESYVVSKEDNLYYAYNRDLNFYIYAGDVDEVADYLSSKGAKIDKDLMYRAKTDNWTSGRAKRAFEAMTAYGDVARWYRDELGYDGINGKGGAAMVVLGEGNGASVAVNGDRYGGVTYLYTTKEGYTAADAPEILAHEYGHAVIKNISGTNGSGQTAALCESVCDILGACYLNGWHLAKVMAGTDDDKNIAGSKLKTMDDYIYDDLDDYGDVFNKYLDNPVYSFFYEIYDHASAAGMVDDYITMSSDAYHYHENAFILSYTVYRVWDRELDRNYEVLANLVMNAIRYLPKDADFSDFRTAFLYSARKSFEIDKVARMSTIFDAAGIKAADRSELVNVGAAKDQSIFHYSLLLGMPYKEIAMIDWEEQYFYDSFDYPGMWYFNARRNGAQVFLDFTGTIEDPKAYPNSVAVYDTAAGAAGVLLLPEVKTGMTYEQIKSVLPGIAELKDEPELDYLYARCIRDDGLCLDMYFTNAMGEPVLTNAIISSAG